MKHVATLLLVLLGVAACAGDDESPAPTPPLWAKVAPEQIAEAKKHGIPVAFENDLGMRFVLIPAGTFLMGSRAPRRALIETPHRVTLTKPLYMQITEATNEQYRHWRRTHDSSAFDEKHSLNGAHQPVVQVSWEEATAFAKWLSQQDRRREYALPTEARWEYACRAGTTTHFWWGDSESEGWGYANYHDSGAARAFSDSQPHLYPRNDGHHASAPAASYPPNDWGLYDMAGNVWEWCADWWRDDYPTDSVTDPLVRSGGSSRVLRGGSWYTLPYFLCSACRFAYRPDLGFVTGGFRLVSPLPEPKSSK